MLNFIVNGRSGLGRGSKVLNKLVKICAKRRVKYAVSYTDRAGHATEIAAKLSTEQPDSVIVAIGGDGTFHETLNGIADPKRTALGFIPSGRGNDFARAAKLELKPEKALDVILNGQPVYIDYIDVSGKRCLNVAGTGLDIDVLERVAGRNGKITYLLSLLHCLNHFQPYELSVTTDGVTTEHKCAMAGVCNGVAIGGGLMLSPLSDLSDGKLNVVIMHMPEDGKLMKVLPKFMKGKHLNLPITTHFLCDEVRVTSKSGKPIQLDGEIYRDLILDCKIVPGGLKTFL